MPIPANTAVILIDPYNDFLHPEGKLYGRLEESIKDSDTVTHIKALVDTARANNIPIFYGLHQQIKPGFLMGWQHATQSQKQQLEHDVFKEGSWGVDIYEGLAPDIEKGDVVVSKHWSSSSFQNTDLDYQLRQRGIENLVFGGLTANTCLESTARYAYELGYNITLLTDATAGFSTEQKDAATNLIWPLFANEVTTVAKWKATLV